jgi:prolyl oligopeptidase
MTLKTTLIGASLIALTACSDTETPDTMTDTATNMATEVKDTVADYVPLTFDTPGQTDEDHLWLEDVEGERALDQVKAWNARSLDRLKADPRYTKMYEDALEIVNSKDKIPYVSYRGGEVHNFWQDEDSVRGIWRRSTLDSYLSDDTQWETVIDFDALAETEGKNWVYKGNSCLAPDYELCIVNLSDGGKDAVVRREFNTRTKTFVEDGFATDESKGTMAWVDAETVLVAVDFGEGSMTDSGYPRTARLLKRGQSIDDAMRLGEATTEDIGYWPGTIEMPDGRREIIVQTSKTFFDYETHWFPRNADGTLGDPVKLPVPTKANLGDMFQGQQLMLLNEDWRGYKTGDLVSFSMEDLWMTAKSTRSISSSARMLNPPLAATARQNPNSSSA